MARKKIWDPIYNIPGRALPKAPQPAAGSLPRKNASRHGSDADGDSSGDPSGHRYGSRGSSGGGGSSGSSSSSGSGGSGSLFDSLRNSLASSFARPSLIPGVGRASQSGGHQRGIQFGHPSHPSAASVSGGNAWSGLLTHALGGGGLLGGGIFGAFGAIAGLFGGGGQTAALPALVPFQISGSVSETVYAGGANGVAGRGVGGSVLEMGQPSGGFVSAVSQSSSSVADQVKQALLNSHSLSDVLAELL